VERGHSSTRATGLRRNSREELRLSRQPAGNIAARKEAFMFHLLLWIIAVLIGIYGVVTIVRGQLLLGIVLIVVAFLVGPGGVSVFN
jgi:hypothetical protein